MLKDIKVALIGHTLPEPVEINFPKNSMKAKALLSLHNFTRVVTKDNKLFDHIAYLKKKLKIPNEETFSLWEMSLCAGLLLTSMLKRNGIN